MINLGWFVYADATPDSFDVYRSIAGVKVSFPNSIATGDQFIFQASTRDVQRIAIGAGTDIDSIVDLITANAKGIKAVKSSDGNSLFIRCTARTNPKLKIQPCSFAAHAGIQSGLYTEKQSFELVGNVPYVAETYTASYQDLDGDAADWYHVVAKTGGVDSLPSMDVQGMLLTPGMCVVEGRISDLQNRPVVGALVDAHIQVPVGSNENVGVVTPNVKTLTDELGRWSIPLMRNQLVLFQIESIGYNEVLIVPDAPFALFKDLKPVDDHLFAPSGDPIGGA